MDIKRKYLSLPKLECLVPSKRTKIVIIKALITNAVYKLSIFILSIEVFSQPLSVNSVIFAHPNERD